MIDERKKIILMAIIQEYFRTAQPVSSGSLVDRYKLKVSSATVRNIMMELEEEGYIFQPHISSGRVPTQLAYRLLKEKIMNEKESYKLKESERKKLDDIFSSEQGSLKEMAKKIADLSKGTVFWAFHKNDLYYTGLSNLFSQPEFKDVDTVQDFSVVIDRMEEIIDDIYDEIKEGEQILIGSNNPFGAFLSVVILKYKKDNTTSIVGILGPMRMDYQHNLALIKFIKNKLR